MNVEINVLAVVLAGLSSMAVGSAWYARSVFGNTWMKLAKVKMPDNAKDSWKPLALAFAASLVTAYVLAHVTYLSNQFFGNSFLQDALTTAFWLWLGLVAARLITHDAFEGRPAKLTVINLGNELATVLVMGLIIGLMGI